MIEKYFVTGVRLKWTCPGSFSTVPYDGSIVLNPNRAAGPMIYDGLDDELYDLTLPHVSTLGLTKGMQIPYSWLYFWVGHTTKKMLSGGDVLTGYMTGCLTTLWMEKGYRYVGHIGTDDTNKAVSSLVKKTFAAAMPQDTTGFNAFAAWSTAETEEKTMKFKKKDARGWVFALVTTSGQFYSLLMFELGEGEWCVGGKKLVPPMNRVALLAQMLR